MPARRGKPLAPARPPAPFDGGPDGEPTPDDFYFLPDPPPRSRSAERPARTAPAPRGRRGRGRRG